MISEISIQHMTTSVDYDTTAPQDGAHASNAPQVLYGDATGYVARIGRSIGAAEERRNSAPETIRIPTVGRVLKALTKSLNLL